MNPGDWCRFLDHGQIEHVAPCPDGHKTGTITLVTTGEILKQGGR